MSTPLCIRCNVKGGGGDWPSWKTKGINVYLKYGEEGEKQVAKLVRMDGMEELESDKRKDKENEDHREEDFLCSR